MQSNLEGGASGGLFVLGFGMLGDITPPVANAVVSTMVDNFAPNAADFFATSSLVSSALADGASLRVVVDIGPNR